MTIDLAAMGSMETYALMTQVIIPRPIAWILTDSGNGSLNLAPFSYFNAVSSDPPLVSVSIGRKSDGSRKDTWENLLHRPECVIHIPSTEHVQAVNASSVALPHGASEIDSLGLETVAVEGWPLPRLTGVRVAMLCRKRHVVELGEQGQGLILAEIVSIHLDEEVLEPARQVPFVDPEALDPLLRLGGTLYAGLGDLVSLQRPRL